MRTNWPAYVAAEKNRIVADEEAFERLVDLFKQAHGRDARPTWEVNCLDRVARVVENMVAIDFDFDELTRNSGKIGSVEPP
jgi:hypothetical protein